MNKISRKSVLAISIAVLGLVWIVAVVAYTSLREQPEPSWGSVLCFVVSVIAAEVYLLVFRKDLGDQGTEPGALGIILTVSFLVIAVLLNSVFVLLNYGNFNFVLLTMNTVFIAAYIVVLLWIEQSSARLAKQLIKTEQKTGSSKEISRKLGELLAVTEDAEIKAKILKLKETVDYSTNISTNATAAKEEQMNRQLDELAQLTIGRADRLIILNKVSAAETTWKMRSSTAASER